VVAVAAGCAGAGALAPPGALNLLAGLTVTNEPRDLDEWQLASGDHLHAIRTRPPAQARDDLLLDLLMVRRQMAVPGADLTESDGAGCWLTLWLRWLAARHALRATPTRTQNLLGSPGTSAGESGRHCGM
jgi:hypothetical protein